MVKGGVDLWKLSQNENGGITFWITLYTESQLLYKRHLRILTASKIDILRSNHFISRHTSSSTVVSAG